MPDLTTAALKIHVFCALLTKFTGQEREIRLSERYPGLTGLDAGVLMILAGRESTLREVSEQMMLSPATLVPVVDRLEQRGWLVRSLDGSDRRRKLLSLTPAGRAVAEQLPALDRQEKLLESLRALGEENSIRLAGLLEQVLSEMTAGSPVMAAVLRRLEQEEPQNGVKPQ